MSHDGDVSSARTVQVPLSQGMFAIIDEADADIVLSFSWFASRSKGARKFYAICRTPARMRGEVRTSQIAMHRLILGFPELSVDHRDGNTLNNTRANLRTATRSEQQRNRESAAGSSSQYKGVSRERTSKPSPWRASIYLNGRHVSLGRFKTEEEAALAYDRAAAAAHGEFARLNFAPASSKPQAPAGAK